MTARTDQVRSIRESREAAVIAVDQPGGTESLVAAGRLGDFRCVIGEVREEGNVVALAPACADALGVKTGDLVRHVARL